MHRAAATLSPKLKIHTHPKHALNWRPGTPGFWRPKLGASKMKWNFSIPYRRATDSLLHYPEVSHVTGKPIDWYHGEPDDGYGGERVYGEHTLQLQGLPLGRTPEYLQERLRRFFSKFGPVRHCRAEPHPLDPYQCNGMAFVSFRDNSTAMKALKAPLKFPASMHDKIVSMRHLDSDKRNDPDYREKSRFWNNELVGLARRLHEQLLAVPKFRSLGKPLLHLGHDLLERELVLFHSPGVAEPVAEPLAAGRGGVPESKGLHGSSTRWVPAGPAVRRRFGTWEAFLAEPPMDQLFSIQSLRVQEEVQQTVDKSSSESAAEVLVVLPRLVSTLQRSRILFQLRTVLEQRLQGEFSVWWREGKIPLPEYTQRRVNWWRHKPHLPWELQIQSRSRVRHLIHDERYLYKMQLLRARNEKRKERRAQWTETRTKMIAEKQQALEEKRKLALSAVEGAKCGGLLGSLSRLLPAAGARGFSSNC